MAVFMQPAASHQSLYSRKLNGRSIRIAFYYLYVACLVGVNASVLIARTSYGTVESNRLFTVSWIVLHVLSVGVFLSLLRKQDTRNLVVLTGLAAYVLASVFWSAVPSSTLIYGGMMVGNLLVAHLIASELSLHEIVRMLTRIILALSIAGIIAYYLRYESVYYFDVHQRPNVFGGEPFRGFTAHKILMGLYATLGAIGVLSLTRGIMRVLLFALLALSVSLTSSVIGVVLFVTALPLYVIIRFFAEKRSRVANVFIFGAVLVGLCAYIVSLLWEQMLGLLERDSTLTGRTTLWNLGLSAWLERPWFGWGFTAYLQSSNSVLADRAFNRYGSWEIPHFHQSFIQTAVDLGVVGVAALAALILYVLIGSYRYAISVDASVGSFAFTATAIMVAASFVSFIFFNYNHFGTFLLMLLFFALRRDKMLRTDELAGVRHSGNKREAHATHSELASAWRGRGPVY